MSNGWPYAWLSQLAKKAGGPEKLVNGLFDAAYKEGYSKGQVSMVPVVVAASVFSVAGTILVGKIISMVKEKKAFSKEAIEQAKAELIQGIKDYDAAHPDGPTPEELAEIAEIESAEE